jgi:hypothetical protein
MYPRCAQISLYKELISAFMDTCSFEKLCGGCHPRLGIKVELCCNRIEVLDFNDNNGILERRRLGLSVQTIQVQLPS